MINDGRNIIKNLEIFRNITRPSLLPRPHHQLQDHFPRPEVLPHGLQHLHLPQDLAGVQGGAQHEVGLL